MNPTKKNVEDMSDEELIRDLRAHLASMLSHIEGISGEIERCLHEQKRLLDEDETDGVKQIEEAIVALRDAKQECVEAVAMIRHSLRRMGENV
jgi:uncharacterized protein YbgA (DUF1722 family)